jgi:hypothetical protein
MLGAKRGQVNESEWGWRWLKGQLFTYFGSTAGRILGSVQQVIGSGSRRASGHTQTVTLLGEFSRLRLISE